MYSVQSFIATAVTLPLLGILAVLLRFYVRLRVKFTYIGIDDSLIAFSCVLVCGIAADAIIGTTRGELGRDADLIEPDRVNIQAKADLAMIIVERIAFTCVRLSILLFYRRIFVYDAFRRANNVLILLITLWGISFLFASVFSCGSDSHRGHPCSRTEWIALWFAITGVICDVAVLAMPYPGIRRLQMSRRDKIGLAAVFLLGTLSTVFGIVRLGFVVKTFTIYSHPSDSMTSPNRSPPNFWTVAELSVGVLAACLPALNPLFKRLPHLSEIYASLKHNVTLRSDGKPSVKISKSGTTNVECVSGSSSTEGIRPGLGPDGGSWKKDLELEGEISDEPDRFEMVRRVDVV